MRNPARVVLVAPLIAIVGPGAVAHGTGVSFVPLGDFSGGSFYSLGQNVSADGSVVVGISDGALGLEAFRWTEVDGMIGLGDLPGGIFFSDGMGVSADGSTVVGRSNSYYASEGHHEAFRWTAATGIVGLGDFWGGWFSSTARAASADGSVAVGFGYHGGAGGYDREAFRWTEATGLVGLGYLSGSTKHSDAGAVSADGSVVVGRSMADLGGEAFRWTEEDGMVGLGDLPGGEYSSTAYAVSADGQVVIGSSIVGIDPYGQPKYEVFRWTEADGMVGLGFYLGPENPHDVSADGSVIVGELWGNRPFVWDEVHGPRELETILTEAGIDLTGWNLWTAYGVSADGTTIVGSACNPDGYLEAYVARIPEPATLALLAMGLACAIPRRATRCPSPS